MALRSRLVVEEYEKTISELISERERGRVVHQIEREKMASARAQTMEDLSSAEAAFNDVQRKCERTKEVISSFQAEEERLKADLQDVTVRAKKAEERYEVLKAHAEGKLGEYVQQLR